ncbi:MAG: hypothetical protein LBQ73_02660, partial [Tannerellaceae bacterium]|nr:hypothetical protein [Tannerellaceae bacterium]
MKRIMERIKLTLLCLGILPHLCAQVTVGVAENPAEGALLQLKDIVAAAGSKNAERGLLMPRVSLEDETSLAPMFPEATAGEKTEHAGLIVYNLTDKAPLKKGVAVWDGIVWKNLKVKDAVIGTEVKKLIYESLVPLGNKSVSVRSIDVSMNVSDGMAYHAVPRFKVTPDYKPSDGNPTKYLYYITRYWTGEDLITFPNGRYSNDLNTTSFNEKNYSVNQVFRAGYMTIDERDEVWLLDDSNSDIFQIHFFEMGPDYERENRL